MSDDGQLPLLTAVYDRLRLDAGVTAALPGGAEALYHHVPAQSEYPYVVFRLTGARPIETKDSFMLDAGLLVEVFTSQSSRKTSMGIMREIRRAIESTPLEVDGHITVDCRFISSAYEAGNASRGGREALRYAVIIEPRNNS